MSNIRGPLNSSDIPEAQPVGGVFNAQSPAPLDGQGCALQLDANGNLKVVNEAGGVASIVQIEDSSGNALNSDGSGALNVAVVSGGGSNASVGTNGAVAPTSSTQVGGSDGTNLQPLQVDASKNLKTVINAALPAGTNVIGHVIADSGSTTAVTGNVTVVQGTGTNLHAVIDTGSTTAVTGNVTVVQGTGTNLHTVLDSGVLTSITNALPAGSNVIGHVIADTGSTTAVTGNVTVVQGTGTNLHTVVDSGHIIIDSGSTTAVSGTVTVAGAKTNNNAAPGATNIGTLPALANAANPSWTEGNQVALSVDLSGHQRVVATGPAAQGAAVSGNPLLISGKDSTGAVSTVAVNLNTIATLFVVGGADGILNLLGAVGVNANDGGRNYQLIWPMLFNGTTWDRARTAGIGNAVAATGIAAAASYGEYLSTAPAPTTGQYSALQTDYAGSLFVKNTRRSQTVSQATTIASSSGSTAVLAAQAAGIFADLSNVIITVTTAATTSIPFTATLSDGTKSFIFDMETGSLTTAAPAPLAINFNPPLSATTAATAWTVTLSVNTVTVNISINAVLQKAS